MQVSTGGDYTSGSSTTLGSKTVGSNIVDNVKIKLSDSSSTSGYIRAKVYYSGTIDAISINTAIALNSLLPTETYSASGYAWKLGSDGYYYLITSGDTLKSVDKSSAYTLFDTAIKVPDLMQFNGLALSISNVTLNVVAEAIQSKNLTNESGTEVNTVTALTNLITSAKIFTNVGNAGYVVNFDSKGGSKVSSIVTTNDSIELPKVGTQSVTWYSDSALTKSFGASNVSKTVTSNITLYAKYTANKVVMFF